MRDAGWTLVELLMALAIVLVLAGIGSASLQGPIEEARLRGSARIFKSEFALAKSWARKTNAYVALRFETVGGQVCLSTYLDGNHNGVRSADIRSGLDPRVAGPVPLESRTLGVRVGILPGTPAPDGGSLDPSDPIRFSNDTVSFAPVGGATPGTFYLASPHAMAAVRVSPGSGRVRLLVYRGAWREL